MGQISTRTISHEQFGGLIPTCARKTMFRCRFLAIVDVRTIYRDHAKHASPVEWCLLRYNCPASWPCLACQVVFEKGRFALQAGHASPVKWCLNEKVDLLCKLAMPRLSSG